MTVARAFGWMLFVVLIGGLGVLLVLVAPQWYAAEPAAPRDETAGTADATAAKKIKATLFYVSEDGRHLVPVEREIPYGEGLVEQAKRIVEAEITLAPSPLVSALPAGTRLRALYVTDRGQAYVDLSGEVATAHAGGSLNELLTVYAVVNALTANLPAVSAVQLLVDGREVDTLAGHVDLRRPLPKSTRWIEEPGGPATKQGTNDPDQPPTTNDLNQRPTT
jgi:spore germination protein GerM